VQFSKGQYQDLNTEIRIFVTTMPNVFRFKEVIANIINAKKKWQNPKIAKAASGNVNI